MSLLIRAAALTHFEAVAAQCGLNPTTLLRQCGLPLRCLCEPDLKIPARQVALLLETAAQTGNEPAFGLCMAESRRLSNLGPLGLLVRDEPTLRDALEVLVRYLHVHNEAMTLRLEAAGGLVVIREEILTESGEPVRQATELALAVTYRMLRTLMGAQWQPRLVCFTHRAPPRLDAHRRVFGTKVEFGHEFNGIVCNESDLDIPNPGADPVMANYARQALAGAATSDPNAFSNKVRQLVVLLLPRGLCRADVVAAHLGVTRRTVARHLQSEGTSFGDQVNAVRRELTQRYLTEGSRSLAEVSALIGFAAPSAFSRWHRQIFGQAARTLAKSGTI